MFRPFLLLTLSVMALWGCDVGDDAPENLIPQDKMAEILTEIHVAEARVTQLQLRSQDSSIFVYAQLQKSIWAKNKVDTSSYRRSYTYYTSHPALLTEIYGQVEKKLAIREKKKNIKL